MRPLLFLLILCVPVALAARNKRSPPVITAERLKECRDSLGMSEQRMAYHNPEAFIRAMIDLKGATRDEAMRALKGAQIAFERECIPGRQNARWLPFDERRKRQVS